MWTQIALNNIIWWDNLSDCVDFKCYNMKRHLNVCHESDIWAPGFVKGHPCSASAACSHYRMLYTTQIKCWHCLPPLNNIGPWICFCSQSSVFILTFQRHENKSFSVSARCFCWPLVEAALSEWSDSITGSKLLPTGYNQEVVQTAYK